MVADSFVLRLGPLNSPWLAAVSGLTADDLAELGRGGPRWPGVDHAVVVRAEQGEIAGGPGAFTANVQRLDVMTLDVALAAFPVELAESNLHTSHASGLPAAITLLILDRKSVV